MDKPAARLAEDPTSRWPAVRVVIWGASAYLIAALAWWLQPQIIDGLTRTGGISASAAGLVTGVEVGVGATTSIVLGIFIARWGISLRRLGLIGVGVAFLCHMLSILDLSIPALIGARMVAGFGEGLVLAAGNAALARCDRPARRIAQVLAVYTAGGSLLVTFAPAVGEVYGYRGLFALTGGLTMLLGFGMLLLPEGRIARRLADEVLNISRQAMPLVIAMGLWSMVSASAWAFSFTIGQTTGLSVRELALISGVSVASATLGGAAAAVVGSRFGLIAPIAAALGCEMLAILGFSVSTSPIVFGASLCLILFIAYFVQPYMLALAAAIDGSGGVSSSAAGAYRLGGFFGPILGGILIQSAGGSHGLAYNMAFLPMVIGLVLLASHRANGQGANRQAVATLPS
ncbi:MAG: arabinose transporter permease [Alphaproteobacteria bacterium]|nr:arabinose transporter permease [Alphaproteobacteria bacterium]